MAASITQEMLPSEIFCVRNFCEERTSASSASAMRRWCAMCLMCSDGFCNPADAFIPFQPRREGHGKQNTNVKQPQNTQIPPPHPSEEVRTSGRFSASSVAVRRGLGGGWYAPPMPPPDLTRKHCRPCE